MQCGICNADYTYVADNGNAQWYSKDGQRLCKKCYTKHVTNPKWHRRRIRFGPKRLSAAHLPRIGICAWCRRTLQDGKIKRTHIHHHEYDSTNPLAHTIELCPSCHIRESKPWEKIRK